MFIVCSGKLELKILLQNSTVDVLCPCFTVVSIDIVRKCYSVIGQISKMSLETDVSEKTDSVNSKENERHYCPFNNSPFIATSTILSY